MQLFQDTQKNMRDLLLETRAYASLQKRYLTMEFNDRLSFLLSAIAVAAVCVLLGGIVLLFLSFFLAYLIGNALGNTALGFGCIALLLTILLLLVYARRKEWIVDPIAQLVAKALLPADETATKEQLHEQVNEKQEQLRQHLQTLSTPDDSPVSRIERYVRWGARGIAVYKGVKMGLTTVGAITSLLGGKKKKKHRS